jgi:RHS repeat-associated protein
LASCWRRCWTNEKAGVLETGRPLTINTKSGHYRSFDYAGRQTTELWKNGAATVRTLTYGYDAAGRMTSASDPDSAYAYTYDAASRMQTVSNAGTPAQPSVTLTYAYNADNAVVSVADNLGTTVAYKYDGGGRMIQADQTTAAGAGTHPRVDLTFDAAGRMSKVWRQNGAASITSPGGAIFVTTDITYDAGSRVTGLAHRYTAASGGGAAINTYSFGWDNASQLTSETSIDGVVNYTYDNSSQLAGVTGARTEAYAYDNTGNRNTAGNATTTGNRLTSDGVFNYGYDDEGNLTTKTKISNGEVTTFVWDYRNRLTSATKKTSGGTTLSTSTYKYDLFDHRIERNENGTVLRTVYDGGNAWSDFNSSNTQTVRYLYGRALDQLYARVDATNNIAFYLTDLVGSVRDIVTPAGSLLDHIKYDSFGNILFENAPAAGDRFKYTSREYDAATNLYYYRARYYDSATGRFLGQDPLKFDGGDTNLQRYVGNVVTTRNDPTGFNESIVGRDDQKQYAIQMAGYFAAGVAYLEKDRAEAYAYEFRAGVYDTQLIVFATQEENARRHAFWMAMVAAQVGAQSARLIGIAHETFERSNDSKADRWNNKIGIDIGRQAVAEAANIMRAKQMDEHAYVDILDEVIRRRIDEASYAGKLAYETRLTDEQEKYFSDEGEYEISMFAEWLAAQEAIRKETKERLAFIARIANTGRIPR